MAPYADNRRPDGTRPRRLAAARARSDGSAHGVIAAVAAPLNVAGQAEDPLSRAALALPL